MKKTILQCLLVWFMCCAYGSSPLSAQTVTNTQDMIHLPAPVVDLINAQNRLLIDLACERFVANSNRHEVWILTVHEGNEIEIYTDKKYKVLSLPIANPTDRQVLCGYANSYNSRDLELADSKVRTRDYKDAREMYNLLLHFQYWSDAWNSKIQKRLACLGELEKGNDTETAMKRFAELAGESGTFTNLPDVDKKVPTVVKNLLDIHPR
jgi:hypothetical protein